MGKSLVLLFLPLSLWLMRGKFVYTKTSLFANRKKEGERVVVAYAWNDSRDRHFLLCVASTGAPRPVPFIFNV